MSDIRLIWNNNTATGDFAMSGGALATGCDLETAVLISLFTDRRADPGDEIPASMRTDPRGWWSDTFDGEQIGSKLWQIAGRICNQDTCNWARDQIATSLQWMIEDGVAASVTPRVWLGGKGRINMSVQIVEPSGKASLFGYYWSQEG